MHERMRGRHGRPLAAVIGLMALLAGALAGCSGNMDANASRTATQAPAPPKPQPGGHLVYGVEADPNGLDPSKNAWDVSGIQLANALYDPLMAPDAEGKFRPYLAESMVSSPDYKTWTVKLRNNVSFSNGDRLTADDFVTWMKFMRDSIITGPPLKMVSEVRRVDDLTVQILTSRPWATLDVLFSGQGGYVVSPKQLASDKGTEEPIGTGPFTLKNWRENQKFELAKNPRYWRTGLPYLDTLDFVVIPEGSKRIEQLTNGDVDVISLSAAWDIKKLDQQVADPVVGSKIAVQKDESDSEKDSVMFNVTKPPLNDVRVRQALAYATDVPELAKDAGWPLDHLAQGPLSPGTPFFSPEAYPTYSPEKARELIQDYLSDRRIPNRRREVAFRFVVTDIDATLGHRMVEQWKKAGINAQLDLVDSKQIVRYAVLGEYGALALRYFAVVDPDVLWHFFVGETIQESGVSLNFTRMNDNDINTGMNDGRATLDPALRKQAYARMQKGFAQSMPYLWLARSEWRIASTKRAHDVRSVTLPDGHPAMPLLSGTHRLTDTWLER
jgi:peptide/nickel transport system substrate-binding protein